VLDPRSKCIDSTALMAIRRVLFFFVAFHHLFVQAVEYEPQGVSIDVSCAAISYHDNGKLIKGGLLGDLISFILEDMSVTAGSVA
jgi:hypothetical protein